MARVFVTGGTGFIGAEVVRLAVRAGHDVALLTRGARAPAGGERVVRGDLRRRGGWEDAAAEAELVIHLAQPQAFSGRVTQARAEAYRNERLVLDANLLAAVSPSAKVVYVAGTSFYGDLGVELRDESATPRPRGWGPYLSPAVHAVEGRARRGRGIVTAFPGYVYGDGSWFREYVIEPLVRGKKIHTLSGANRFASPIHVADCARALLHLGVHGQASERYFVVDDEPVRWDEFYARAARALERPLRVRRVSPTLMRLLIGGVVTDSLLSNAVLSNRKLKALGFSLDYPTSREGITDVCAPLKRRA